MPAFSEAGCSPLMVIWLSVLLKIDCADTKFGAFSVMSISDIKPPPALMVPTLKALGRSTVIGSSGLGLSPVFSKIIFTFELSMMVEPRSICVSLILSKSMVSEEVMQRTSLTVAGS